MHAYIRHVQPINTPFPHATLMITDLTAECVLMNKEIASYVLYYTYIGSLSIYKNNYSNRGNVDIDCYMYAVK